jgi:hypothetical protein
MLVLHPSGAPLTLVTLPHQTRRVSLPDDVRPSQLHMRMKAWNRACSDLVPFQVLSDHPHHRAIHTINHLSTTPRPHTNYTTPTSSTHHTTATMSFPIMFTLAPSNRHEIILLDTSSKPTLKALNKQITATIASSPNCAECTSPSHHPLRLPLLPSSTSFLLPSFFTLAALANPHQSWQNTNPSPQKKPSKSSRSTGTQNRGTPKFGPSTQSSRMRTSGRYWSC